MQHFTKDDVMALVLTVIGILLTNVIQDLRAERRHKRTLERLRAEHKESEKDDG